MLCLSKTYFFPKSVTLISHSQCFIYLRVLRESRIKFAEDAKFWKTWDPRTHVLSGYRVPFPKKNTPVPSFITGFHRTWIVYYNTGLLVPCFGFETIRENIDYWVPVALRVKWILIGRFSTNQRQGYEKSVARVENESRRFSFRSRYLSQFKADLKLFKVYSAMPPKKKQTKKKKKKKKKNY